MFDFREPPYRNMYKEGKQNYKSSSSVKFRGICVENSIQIGSVIFEYIYRGITYTYTNKIYSF